LKNYSLKPGIGYVWAITNLEEAVYFYAPTREGDSVHLLLKDFKGVLVSDFYTAYDSLDCPQQKCLIHLIRDLNDDLLKEPFNEEIKKIASDFSQLLKPIVETVDRFGLKTRFLRKHKVFVDRFFRRLARKDYQNETAIKCKKRLVKNRHTLFTFLDYDNVPWNNNNAEHAIKAFALLRRNFSGVTTEKGIREYLILLSICETCRFKGINFLDSNLETEHPNGIPVQHLFHHFRLIIQGFEILQPALRRDFGIVRAIEHLVLQPSPDLFFQTVREILRGPPGEVIEDIGFMQ
jgi:hypothetical protein